MATPGNKKTFEPGQMFGRLKILRETTARRHGEVVWQCECECKKIVFVRGSSLSSGATRSCGCLKTEVQKARTLNNASRYRPTEKQQTALEKKNAQSLADAFPPGSATRTIKVSPSQ